MSDTATTTAPPPDSVASADIPSPQDADSDGMTTAQASAYAPHSDPASAPPAPAAPAAPQMVQMSVDDLNALMDARIAAQAASTPQPPAPAPPAAPASAHDDIPPVFQAHAARELGEHATKHQIGEFARLSSLHARWYASSDAARDSTLKQIDYRLSEVKSQAESRTWQAQMKERDAAAKAAAAPDTADAYAGVPDSAGETLARLHQNLTPAILAETADEFAQWPQAHAALSSGRVHATSWLNSLNLGRFRTGREVVDEVNRSLASLNATLTSTLVSPAQPTQPAGIPAPGNPGIGAPANPGAQGIQTLRNSGSGTVGDLSSRITARLNEQFGEN